MDKLFFRLCQSGSSLVHISNKCVTISHYFTNLTYATNTSYLDNFWLYFSINLQVLFTSIMKIIDKLNNSFFILYYNQFTPKNYWFASKLSNMT